MRRDRGMYDAPAVVCQHQEHVQDLQTDRRHNEEGERYQRLQVIVDERSPGLRGRLAAPDHVFADAGLTNVDAEFEQFAVNMRRAPEWIFAAQHADQLANLVRYRRAARLAVANLPTPEQAEALAMPANHCGGLDHGEA